jgi:hypothetical protein
MVQKFWLTNAKKVSMPMELNIQFSKQQCPVILLQEACMCSVLYAKAIGSILWPTVVSRPDMVFAVGILSQYIQNPGPEHWKGVKRVISYLGSTKDLWLTFGGEKDTLVKGYCDADWSSQEGRHSISGFSFHYGHGVVSWSSKKQAIVALLSTEAEYITKMHAAKEALWLKTFINKVNGGIDGPLTLMANNQGAIALAKDNKFHLVMKHINLHYHFIHEAVENGKVKMKYIPSADNVADIFMKPLAKPKFKQFIELLGLAMMKEWRRFGCLWILR